jgi:hypothetical protein
LQQQEYADHTEERDDLGVPEHNACARGLAAMVGTIDAIIKNSPPSVATHAQACVPVADRRPPRPIDSSVGEISDRRK